EEHRRPAGPLRDRRRAGTLEVKCSVVTNVTAAGRGSVSACPAPALRSAMASPLPWDRWIGLSNPWPRRSGNTRLLVTLIIAAVVVAGGAIALIVIIPAGCPRPLGR